MDRVFDILPFSFLDIRGRQVLRDHLSRHTFDTGQTIVRQGSLTDRRVFLVLQGEVDVIDHHQGPDAVTSKVSAGHWFGERAALLGTPRAFEFRAALDETELAAIEPDAIRELVRTNPSFAQALTFQLRQKHALFSDFDRFVAAIRRDAASGHLEMHKLLPLYRRLQPALHPHLHDDLIDLGALTYALNRLPHNVTSTFAWFLTEDIPYLYASVRDTFTPVPTNARRRTAYEMMNGKTLILLRDGLSDLLDFVTCLCIYAVEVRKLRRRLQQPDALRQLADGIRDGAVGDIEPPVLQRLGQLWPDSLAQRLRDLTLHHEDFVIGVYKDSDNYNASHSERWTRQIASSTEALLGCDPALLPDDMPVYIISSNTHSVTNCLSRWLVDHADTLLAWGRTNAPHLVDHDWYTPDDRIIAIARLYLEANPEARVERDQTDACAGTAWLRETAYTGIAVQLFDLSKLADRPIAAGLRAPSGAHGLLVNIDYAFGQQAEPILANLVALFGHRIRSVNVLGKAGALVGKRGDIMLASGFIAQGSDTLQPASSTLDVVALHADLPGRDIHVGRVLTVVGTILQNAPLLHYYRNLWQCVGLEMEGSWYCRQLREAQQLGILRPDIRANFAYYTSDLPLEPHQSLAAGLGATEGVPPLYAITRQVLRQILSGE